jgi:hypothetical protein
MTFLLGKVGPRTLNELGPLEGRKTKLYRGTDTGKFATLAGVIPGLNGSFQR